MENFFGIVVASLIVAVIVAVLVHEYRLNRDMFKDWRPKK